MAEALGAGDWELDMVTTPQHFLRWLPEQMRKEVEGPLESGTELSYLLARAL